MKNAFLSSHQKLHSKIFKMAVCCSLAAIILLTLGGCKGKSSNNLTAELETEDAIKTYIEERVTKECVNILYSEDVDAKGDGEPVSVLIINENASVTIRVRADFCIPSAAEELLPIILEALEENGTALGKINFTYYRKNNFGIVDSSMVDWTTNDGEKGTFASAPDDVMYTGYSVEDLREYYKDYEELVERIRNGSAS